MQKQKSRALAGTRDAADCKADRQQSSPYAPFQPKIKALTAAPGHVIYIERRRELAAVDDVVRAIVALGHLRKRTNRLILESEVVTPTSLRNYLARNIAFSRNGKTVAPPWSIVLTILSRAQGGEVPVCDVDAAVAS